MRFEEALAHTLQQEGGWYDGSRPSDPNPTMRGITQKTYDAWRTTKGLPIRSVRLIADQELEAIYHAYWVTVQGDTLPPGLNLHVFDHAVNSGAGDAIRVLQKLVGTTEDGALGPKTLAALQALLGQRGLREVVLRYGLGRDADYAREARGSLLANLPVWIRRSGKITQVILTSCP